MQKLNIPRLPENEPDQAAANGGQGAFADDLSRSALVYIGRAARQAWQVPESAKTTLPALITKKALENRDNLRYLCRASDTINSMERMNLEIIRELHRMTAGDKPQVTVNVNNAEATNQNLTKEDIQGLIDEVTKLDEFNARRLVNTEDA